MRENVAAQDEHKFGSPHDTSHGEQSVTQVQDNDNRHGFRNREKCSEFSNEIDPMSPRDDGLICRSEICHQHDQCEDRNSSRRRSQEFRRDSGKTGKLTRENGNRDQSGDGQH